jgi:hypothetical protein
MVILEEQVLNEDTGKTTNLETAYTLGMAFQTGRILRRLVGTVHARFVRHVTDDRERT